jgi:multimeric flavodoxin WrbA
MKIVGICGSPRDGNTAWVMGKLFKDIPKENVEAELIQLKNVHMELCDGCLACEDTEQCSIDDDMNTLYEKLSQCDRVVIGTPVYFDSVPALLKNFIDRLNPLCVSEKLKNKDLYLIVIGQLKEEEGENSRKKVIDYIKDLCEIFGMTFRKAWGMSAREPTEASKLENIGEVSEEIKREIYG